MITNDIKRRKEFRKQNLRKQSPTDLTMDIKYIETRGVNFSSISGNDIPFNRGRAIAGRANNISGYDGTIGNISKENKGIKVKLFKILSCNACYHMQNVLWGGFTFAASLQIFI